MWYFNFNFNYNMNIKQKSFQKMNIERIEIRKIFLPFKMPFKTSGWIENGNSSIIVRIDADGAAGWGEAPAGLKPFYSEETAGTIWSMMKEVLIPVLFETKLTGKEIFKSLFPNIRGNRIAISGLDFALWDLVGKLNNKSISQMLGGTRKKIDVGVSIGIQENIGQLLELIENYLEEGYRRIKIKIKPGCDIKPVREVRKKWENILLQVDANSAYSLNDAEHLAELDEFKLLLIEQPLDYDDLYEHSLLQKKIKTPVCLDESIVSPSHAKSAIEMGACKIINIKSSRVGGLAAAKKIHDISEEKNIPVWCGGMLETGIGRAFNAALASLPNFRLPGDVSANSRYFAKDIVKNPFELNKDGTLTVPDKPGCGAEIDEEFLEKVTLEKEIIKNK
jgi:O-succinylbenzoate synthase